MSKAPPTWSAKSSTPRRAFSAMYSRTRSARIGMVRRLTTALSTSALERYGSKASAWPAAMRTMASMSTRWSRTSPARRCTASITPPSARSTSSSPGIVGTQHHRAGDQPRRRLAEHRRVRIPSDVRGVLAHDAVGEGVVGRHPRPDDEILGRTRGGGIPAGSVLLGEIVQHLALHDRALRRGARRIDPGERARRDDLGQVRQQPAAPVLVDAVEAERDPLGELARRLAGEREPEDLIPGDELVRDQPHHPARHGLGLAAAGTGDDERGSRRRLDHALLGRSGRRKAERCGDVGGGDAVPALPRVLRPCFDGLGNRSRAHALTAGMLWMRHGLIRTWVSAQCASTWAVKLEAAMPRPASATRARKAARASSPSVC